MNHKVSPKRHLAKTISYRLISTCIGFVIMWLATGSLKIGAAFGVIELIYKPIQYYLHERVWYKWIKFGLIPQIEKKKNLKQFDGVETDEPFVKTRNKPLPKVQEENTPITEELVSPPPSGRKILGYSSNR